MGGGGQSTITDCCCQDGVRVARTQLLGRIAESKHAYWYPSPGVGVGVGVGMGGRGYGQGPIV